MASALNLWRANGYNGQLGSLASRPLTFAAKVTAVQLAQGSEANPVFTKKLELRALVYCHHGDMASLFTAGSALFVTGLLSYFLLPKPLSWVLGSACFSYNDIANI